jgi:hypothetical protein
MWMLTFALAVFSIAFSSFSHRIPKNESENKEVPMKKSQEIKRSIFSFVSEVGIHISAHLLCAKRLTTTMGV